MRRPKILVMSAALAVLVTACSQSSFATAGDPAAVEAALTNAGLQVCASGDVNWDTTPGFENGKYFVLDTSCAQPVDPGKSGAVVTVAKFDSQEARDAAQARFLTQYRRGASTGAARTLGPLLITVDGSQKSDTVDKLKAALESLQAQ